jgi:hypothetical protein
MGECEDLPEGQSCVLSKVSIRIFDCLCLCEISEGSDASIGSQREDS